MRLKSSLGWLLIRSCHDPSPRWAVFVLVTTATREVISYMAIAGKLAVSSSGYSSLESIRIEINTGYFYYKLKSCHHQQIQIKYNHAISFLFRSFSYNIGVFWFIATMHDLLKSPRKTRDLLRHDENCIARDRHGTEGLGQKGQ